MTPRQERELERQANVIDQNKIYKLKKEIERINKLIEEIKKRMT